MYVRKPKVIHSFFAVTETSVYWVKDKRRKNDLPSATKIIGKTNSKIQVGKSISGPMIAICERLIPYIPEGGGITSVQRKIEMVNSCYWLAQTSKIVALFKSKQGALNCSKNKDLQPCDPRWEAQTKSVIEGIGQEHPFFEICRHPGLCLKILEEKIETTQP